MVLNKAPRQVRQFLLQQVTDVGGSMKALRDALHVFMLQHTQFDRAGRSLQDEAEGQEVQQLVEALLPRLKGKGKGRELPGPVLAAAASSAPEAPRPAGGVAPALVCRYCQKVGHKQAEC